MEKSEFLRIVGERIRSLRKARGISQLDLALEAGVNASHISDIERGATNPSLGVLFAITKALGVHLAEVFEEIPQHGRADWQKEEEISKLLAAYRSLPSDKRHVVRKTLKALLDSLKDLT